MYGDLHKQYHFNLQATDLQVTHFLAFARLPGPHPRIYLLHTSQSPRSYRTSKLVAHIPQPAGSNLDPPPKRTDPIRIIRPRSTFSLPEFSRLEPCFLYTTPRKQTPPVSSAGETDSGHGEGGMKIGK
jgi:hypothetical protein